MKEQLKDYCSEDLLKRVFDTFKSHFCIINNDSRDKHPTNYKTLMDSPHSPNYWNVTSFVQTNNMELLDKLRVISSFIICDGVVRYKNALCMYRDVAILVHNLYHDRIIDDNLHHEILSPWNQVVSTWEEGKKPYFS